MNKRIIFLSVFLSVLFCMKAVAQKGVPADVEAFKQLVTDKPADYEKQLAKYFKKNKKNAENLVAFGNILFESGDTAQAHAAAQMALAATKNRYAPAYVLLGDIAVKAEDGGKAVNHYDMAIYFNPKLAEAYTKYANLYSRIDPKMAIAKLEELRNNCPDYPVDREIAHLCYKRMLYTMSIIYYKRIPNAELTPQDCVEYGLCHYLSKNYSNALDIIRKGLEKDPNHISLNRMAFFCCDELDMADEAVQYGKRLFSLLSEEGEQPSELDYLHQGNAYMKRLQPEKAISFYQEGLKQKEGNRELCKAIAEAYVITRDYRNAIKYFMPSLSTYDSPVEDHYYYAQLWMDYALTLEDDEQASAYKFATDAYDYIVREHPRDAAKAREQLKLLKELRK